MDPNSSLGKICLWKEVVVISSDTVEGSGDWNSSKFQDTAKSGKKKETKGMVFYQMETKEVSDRSVTPCFVNGLEAYNGEIKLGVEENMISNQSFLHMTKAITEFGVRTIIIYPDIDPFLEETEGEEKSNDDMDHLLDFNIDDVPLLGEEGISPFMYKVELDGKIIKEEDEAVKRIKGKALKEKDNHGAFIFPIRLEGHVNKNALADTGSDINTMPYRFMRH
nr:hypothetical protein [Tanacetum cinerariifolium]